MTAHELNDYVAERRARARDKRATDPGLAECAIELAASERHGAVPVEISEICDGIVCRLVAELEAAGPPCRNALIDRRRLLRFALERAGVAGTTMPSPHHGTQVLATVGVDHTDRRERVVPPAGVASAPSGAT
jgi:hypothetical protein